jgi:hypothetical protein
VSQTEAEVFRRILGDYQTTQSASDPKKSTDRPRPGEPVEAHRLFRLVREQHRADQEHQSSDRMGSA